MAAFALARLGTLTGRAKLLGKAYATLEAISGQLNKFAMASGQSLLALDFVLGPTHEVLIADAMDTESDSALQALFRQFWPNKIVARRVASVDDKDIAVSLKPLLAGQSSSNEQVTVFVCEHGTCQAPLIGLSAWLNFLANKRL